MNYLWNNAVRIAIFAAAGTVLILHGHLWFGGAALLWAAAMTPIDDSAGGQIPAKSPDKQGTQGR